MHPDHGKAAWHTLADTDVFSLLSTNQAGLSTEDAEARLKVHGKNCIKPPQKRSLFNRLISQFNNLLIYVLLGAALVTFLLGKYLDTSVIMAVVIVNALIGFIQEGRAEQAIQAVSKILSLRATVFRDRSKSTISAENLVPGDVVIIQSGDKVPADLYLFQSKNLKISEAILTGETQPISKRLGVHSESSSLADRLNMAYSGTLVTYGYGQGIVVSTGDETEIGKITQLLENVETLTTPLLQKMAVFARWITLFILATAALIFAYGLFIHAYPLDVMFTAAVGIAVAAIPEGLPVVLTITLAIGVQRMASCHAIIRRLPAIETLGSVMIVCSDKTGTLTKNEMTVQTISLPIGVYIVTGTGYSPSGQINKDDSIIDPVSVPDLVQLSQAAVLCNEAVFNIKDDEYHLHGDPTEGALITLALKAGIDYLLLRKEIPTTDLIPFESEHRLMATLHHDHSGSGYIYVKGAPEAILKRCRWQQESGRPSPIDNERWENEVKQIAAKGQRTLAIAFKPVEQDKRELMFDDIDHDLILLGLVGISDPPREESLIAIQECKHAGIRVKMITGDHAETALAIANQLGIGDGHSVLTGVDLDELDSQQLVLLADKVDVFARAHPENKLRLVQALQQKNYVVAMTGDGVNDAPALKRANIGIAMGLKGTEVAKESSEMVLTDDNFSSIVAAIKEGRTVYDNLKKAITFLLPINGGESLSLIVAILFGYTLPITPVQILWINMVSSAALTMALAFEPSEPNVMYRKPVSIYEPLLSRLLVWRIIFVSIVFLAGIFGIFKFQLSTGATIDSARTMAVNTLIILEVFYLFSSRYIHGPSLTLRGIRGTPAVLIAVGAVIILQASFTYLPFMQYLFNTQSLDLLSCIKIGAIGILGFIVLEVDKLITLHYTNKNMRMSR